MSAFRSHSRRDSAGRRADHRAGMWCYNKIVVTYRVAL